MKTYLYCKDTGEIYQFVQAFKSYFQRTNATAKYKFIISSCDFTRLTNENGKKKVCKILYSTDTIQ